jgi:hypothetical protein
LFSYSFQRTDRELIEGQMDEREATQRMWRLRLGSDAPLYANLGRYYEPFEERVAPITAAALEAAFPPIPSTTLSLSAPLMDEVPMGVTASSPLAEAIQLPQVFCPTPTPVLHQPSIPPAPLPVRTEHPAGVTQTDPPHQEDFGSVDRAEKMVECTKEIDSESKSEEEEYAEPGPSNQRPKTSTRSAREKAGPYSSKNSRHKARTLADEDCFPHPPIPHPGDGRHQAKYNGGKQQWWSQQVLQPLLRASPKPLSLDAILSIIKKDLELEDNAWKGFYYVHLVSMC